MAKAKHPHDAARPEPQRVLDAIESGDIDKLKFALTVRQKRFAEEYVIDFNATAACIRAGYAKQWADRQGHTLVKHKGIAAYIDHLTQSKASKIMAIDPDYVIAQVTDIIQRSGTKDGDKLRGLELLARHLGMFVDRTEISGPDGGAIKHEEIQNEANEFQRRIAGLAKRSREGGDTLKSVG